MAGAPDALQGGGDGGRRLDEHHFVQIADVDAHLQRTSGDDGLQRAFFEPRFHFRANLARQGAVVRVSHRRYFIGVELQRDLLRHAAAIGEEQRRAVGVDHIAERVGKAGSHTFWPLSAAIRAASGKRTRKSMRLSAAESTMPTCRAWPRASRPPI